MTLSLQYKEPISHIPLNDMLMSLFAIFVIYCFVSATFKYLVTTVSTFTVGDVLQEIPGLVSVPYKQCPACLWLLYCDSGCCFLLADFLFFTFPVA